MAHNFHSYCTATKVLEMLRVIICREAMELTVRGCHRQSTTFWLTLFVMVQLQLSGMLAPQAEADQAQPVEQYVAQAGLSPACGNLASVSMCITSSSMTAKLFGPFCLSASIPLVFLVLVSLPFCLPLLFPS